MNWKIKYSIIGIACWFVLFLGWEWWQSYPRVRLSPVLFPESREAKIDSILTQSLSQFLIPGLAVGIVEDEKVTYLKAFGYENMETRDTLTLLSMLPVASISKIFTALSLANFALEKGIPIDTTFNSLLPKNRKLPSEFDNISLRDLLTHTSGLADKQSLKNLLNREESNKLSILPDHIGSPDLENKAFHYADVNFDLLGYVLENTMQDTFENLIQENTLRIAGMEKSHFLSEPPSDTAYFEGYKQTFLWKRIQSMKLKYARYPSPSSGLVVTPTDLSKALLHLCRGSMGNFGDDLRWLQADSETPAGFQKITLNDRQFIGHLGEQGGFSSILLYSHDLEIGFFLLSNSQDKPDFRQKISSEILQLITP